MSSSLVTRICLTLSICLISTWATAGEPQWVEYEGKQGPGKGKHIVLVGGDEEYRSEEALPQLGKILARHHGFKCTVLFAINPKTGEINPDQSDNIPGLEALKTADLMIVFLRFRDLPDEQMKHIVDYVDSGRPIIGMRTSTHAFNIKGRDRTYARYSFNSKDWPQGFGRQVLGETWINHHGGHKRESTRGLIASDQKDHPIVKGIEDGDIWGPTDVYGVRLPQPKGCVPLVMGQVLQGMKPDDPPVEGRKNDPMMPVAWTNAFPSDSGRVARVFNTTMGASEDLESEGLRRLMVNACYWCVGLEDQIKPDSKVDIVGSFKPTKYGFKTFTKGVKPADHAW